MTTTPSKLLIVCPYDDVAAEHRLALAKLDLDITVLPTAPQALDWLAQSAAHIVVLPAEAMSDEFVARAVTIARDTHFILLVNGTDFDEVVRALNRLTVVSCIDHHAESSELYAAVDRSIAIRENRPPPDPGPTQRTLLTLREALRDLRIAQQQIELMLSHVIGARLPEVAARTQLMVEHSRTLATQLKLGQRQSELLVTATRLHALGRALLPDALVQTPLHKLKGKEEKDYQQHPLLAERALFGIAPLAEVAKLLRHQHERLDGRGYPDGLEGEFLHPLAQLVATVRDFHDGMAGALDGRKVSAADRLASMRKLIGSIYTEANLDALAKVIDSDSGDSIDQSKELMVALSGARAGMVLARDLLDGQGRLLLGRGHKLDGASIENLQAMEADGTARFSLHVARP